MEHKEHMRDFVARFNRLVGRVSSTLDPSPEILISCFINALPSEVAFFLKMAKATVLKSAQEHAIELEDNMITSGLMKIDSIRSPIQQPYQPKREYLQPRLLTSPLRPMIEAAHSAVFCPFHDNDAHSESTCPENLRMIQIMGYTEATPSSSFVPKSSSDVVSPQTDNFDGDSAAGYFDEPPVNEKEEYRQYALL